MLLAIGGTLFVRPAWATTLWGWTLTPLTAQVVAAWLVAFGCAALMALRESDLGRLRISFTGYTVLALAQLLALARFRDQLRWGSAAATVYLVFLVCALGTGAAGWWRSRAAAAADPSRSSDGPR